MVGNTHMLVWKSKEPAKVIVVCIHGLALCARAYKQLGDVLSHAGVDGYAVNVRGFGPDRKIPERAKLNCVDTVEDVSGLLKELRSKYPEYKVHLLGESMGAALAIRIAAEYPDLIDTVVCSAPAWKLLKVKRTAVKGIVELLFYSKQKPGPAGKALIKQASSDPELTEHLLEDPAHKLKLTAGEAAAFLRFTRKTGSYSRKLRKPVLMIQGLDDRLVSPFAVAKMYNDLLCNEKTFMLDAKAEHLLLEEGQFSKEVSDKLINWLKSEHKSSNSASTLVLFNDDGLSNKEQIKLKKVLEKAGFKKQAASKRAKAGDQN